MSRVNMQRTRWSMWALTAAALLLVADSLQASMVNGTVFTDNFDGTALDPVWMQDGSPEVDPTSSLTVSGGLATLVGGDAGYNYVSMWGTITQLAGLGTSTDWWAEVRFKVAGAMATPDPTRPINLLSGFKNVGAYPSITGIDFRVEQDESGAAGSTFKLTWNGFDGDDLGRVATLIASGLNKDTFYTVSAHRKSDGNVDIFLDSSLIGTQTVLGSDNPLNFRIGDSSGTASLFGGSLAIDLIKVGEAAIQAHPGDFDSDGDVDGADFVAWQTNFPKASGATLANGDADGDGDVDGADFVVWQTNFPFTPGPATAAVPEPQALILAGMCALAIAAYRGKLRD